MRITVVGGGNIGTQFAVHCAEKGHDVVVYTSTPGIFAGQLQIVNEQGVVTHEARIRCATDSPTVAYEGAELILVTIPANVMKETAELIYTHASSDAVIGVVPGNGGAECAFKKCIERGNVFFAVERVPAIARLKEKGKCVKCTGYREELHIAALPKGNVDECCSLIQGIFDIPCKKIDNILSLSLTPSNPILHTTRLQTLFKDYKKGVLYDDIPLFYEEWNDESSVLLMACDDEVQRICRALPMFRLNSVKSLCEHYDSWTVKAMTRKISGISAFKGIKTPAVKVGEKWIPDLKSRYFTADFSFGLALIKQVADFAEADVPNITSLLKWYQRIAVIKAEFCYRDYGIIDRKAFVQFYEK